MRASERGDFCFKSFLGDLLDWGIMLRWMLGGSWRPGAPARRKRGR